jgi:hypothetical protein
LYVIVNESRKRYKKLGEANSRNRLRESRRPLSGVLVERRIVLGQDHDDSCKNGLRHPRILVDPITGLPVLSAGPDAPVLTSEEVNEILSGEL